MAKRPAEEDGEASSPLKQRERSVKNGSGPKIDVSDEDFEDEFEDEYESDDDEILEAGVDGRADAEREAEEKGTWTVPVVLWDFCWSFVMEALLTAPSDAMDVDQQTFIPGRHQLQGNQTLAPDPSAYNLLHSLTTAWPCLSFDILRDDLGDKRKTYPATVYAVAGTQADSRKSNQNELTVMKLSGLSRMDRVQEDSDDEDDDDSEDEKAEAILETKSIRLSSTTNRIRAHRFPPSDSTKPARTLTATMTEAAETLIHDITPHISAFDVPGTVISPQQNQPLATLKMHRSEGYALDWSPLFTEGKLLTGDNDGKIFMTSGNDAGRWQADTRPFTGHSSSVEDIQWSPNERTVFASASSDGTVKVWDTRSKSRRPAVDVRVSSTDINVLSWSRQTVHLLATGADDGQWAVWDLRQWKPTAGGGAREAPTPVASFDFHKEQITSVEWHPTDDSIVAIAAADNTLTLWDLAVELDDEESRDTAGVRDVPPQLLFVHYMASVKECHWHPQIPGCMMATGAEGFGYAPLFFSPSLALLAAAGSVPPAIVLDPL